MPFFEVPEEAIGLVQSDIIGDEPASETAIEHYDEHDNNQDDEGLSTGGDAAIVALSEDEADMEDSDDQNMSSDLPASLDDVEAEPQTVPTSVSKKNNGRAGRARAGISSKSADSATRSSRKRKATELALAGGSEPTPAKKRGRPARSAPAPSARLAAKAASRPRVGRPARTGAGPSAKSNAAAKGIRGRPKKNEEQTTKGEWEVERIVDSGIDADSSEHRYLVKWKGYTDKENTWEPKTNLVHCMDLVRKFDAQQKTRSRTKAEKNGKAVVAKPAESKRRGRKPKTKT